MALREYHCPNGHSHDELFFGDYPKTHPCPECGEPANYVIGGVHFKFDFWYGEDQGAGKYFDSARQRDNFLAKKGLVKAPEGVHGIGFGEKVK